MGILDAVRARLTGGSSQRGKWPGPKKKGEEKTPNEREYIEQKHSCIVCHRRIDESVMSDNLYVCPGCGHHFPMKVQERIELIMDRGAFVEKDSGIRSVDPLEFPGYIEKLDKAKAKSGSEEAVVTGTGDIHGRPVAAGFMAFEFMGGSMGVAVGEKISRIIRTAADRHLPVVLFTSSGGARMQEGIYSLMQMAKTSHAAALLERRRLPLFIVLTHPTTGGVSASFSMLGNVILAEPGALIGFAGPRVIESTIKQKLPEGFQRSEFQEEKGFVDAVVQRKEIKSTLSFLIDTHLPPR